jgi:S-disulfanyl-L-cysteine oxidoreductase SoxD
VIGKIAACAVLGLAFVSAQEGSRSVWDGAYTADQAKRGSALYAKECASCHGGELSGGEEAPPLAGDGFLANWNGLTVGDLFERIRKSMPQQRPGSLSRQTNADILSFMLQVNQFPAGKKEMETQTEVLKTIKIAPKAGN